MPITQMTLRAKKGEGAVQKEELEDHAPGLICLTGGAEGPRATALRQGGMEKALGQVEHLVGIFGQQNVYIELQRHFEREEETRNRAAIRSRAGSDFLCSPPTRSAMPPPRNAIY